jgi:hypothetical protein
MMRRIRGAALLVVSLYWLSGCAFIIKNESPVQPQALTAPADPIPVIVAVQPAQAEIASACGDMVGEFVEFLRAERIFREILAESSSDRSEVTLTVQFACQADQPPRRSVLGTLAIFVELLVPALLPLEKHAWRIDATGVALHQGREVARYDVTSRFGGRSNFFGSFRRAKAREGLSRAKQYAYQVLAHAIRADRARLAQLAAASP